MKMSMRLIDSSEFIKNLTFDTSKEFYGKFMDGSEIAYTSREIDAAVESAPTIDAVSVVRCRECKYGKESKISFDCDGKTSLCECSHMMLIHQWDEYCSFGERKRISYEE